jgi:hypothetical protein
MWEVPALVVGNDVVKGVLRRLGMVGATLIASALIFGAIAGVVVIHRLQSTSVASSTQEQGDKAGEQGDKGNAQGQSHSKSKGKHAALSSPEPEDSQDKDA